MKIQSTYLYIAAACALVAPAKADLTFYYDFGGGTATNAGTVGTGTGGSINSGSVVNATPAPAGSAGDYYNNTNSGNASAGAGINSGIAVDALGMNGAVNYTAMAWVKFDNASGDNMIFGNSGGNPIHHGARGGNYHMGHWGNDTTVGTIDTSWHHVTYRYESGVGQSIIVDGYTIQNTPNNVGGLNNAGASLFIGASENGGGLEGSMDDVAVYNTALNLAQIEAIASGAHLPSSGGLAAIGVANPSGVKITPSLFTVETAQVGFALNNLNDALSALSGVVTTTNNVPEIDLWQAGGGGGLGNFGTNASFPGISDVGDVNDFAMRATATLVVDTAGYYVFAINGDDGGRIRIDGLDVVVDNTLHGPEDREGAVFLTAGNHSLEQIFFERGGGAEAELFLKDSSGNRTLLNVVAVPEPTTLTLAGVMLAAGLRRRRR